MRPLHRRMGHATHLLLGWLFGAIHYPKAQSEAVRAGAHDATPVYVIRGSSFWLALCFCHVALRVGLPDIYFMGGVDLFWLSPWRWLARRLAALLGRPPPAREAQRKRDALVAEVSANRATLIVLPVQSSRARGLDDWNDYLQVLLRLQARQTRPIALLPHTLVTRDQSGQAGGLMDRLFGSPRRPGSLRLWSMLLVFRHGSMRMGQPIALTEWLADGKGEQAGVAALARDLRATLHRTMDEEERVVAGPPLSAYDTMAKSVLHAPSLRAQIAQQAQQEGTPEPLLEVQAASKLREIAANYDVRVIRNMEHVLYQIFHRIYDGIAIDEAGLAEVIEASRRGPVVFCPSHKSHVDYLVLSYVLWTHGIAPPHVAAGANLNFFPIGSLFRRCGAFFLRRSFRDDPLYGATLRSYVGYLVDQGTSLEFFLEGTRSRTGKLLMPRFGLLRMIMDAWRHSERKDVSFVPVSIDYERIIEAKAYGVELRGGSKRAESLRGLLHSVQVLRSRYGKLQVQFGAPISLADFAKTEGLTPTADPAHDTAFRKSAERLGFRILHEVAMVCSVAPISVVATALLGHPNRGMPQGVLIERSLAVLTFLEAVSARLVAGLQDTELRISAVLDAVQKLVNTGEVKLERAGGGDQEPIYVVAPEARVALDYHKNAIMNYFAAAALLSRAVVRHGGQEPLTYSKLCADTLHLRGVFHREFLYRSDADSSASFDETLGAMVIFDLLGVDDNGQIHVHDGETIAHLAGLLDSYVQAYFTAAQAAMDLRAMDLTAHDFVTRSLERARRGYLEGTLSRPEAASRTLMETALAWLCEENVLVQIVHPTGVRGALRFVQDGGQARLQGAIDALTPFL